MSLFWLVKARCLVIELVELTAPYKISKARINVLLGLLKKITSHITRLVFNDKYTNFNALDAISTFPDLIHFSYIGVTANWRVQPLTQQPVLLQFSRLTQLYLDFPINMKLQLEPILKNSPNLQNLAYGERRRIQIHSSPAARTVTKLDDISSRCQELIYLESGGGQLSADYRLTLLASIKQNKGTHAGVRYFMASQSEGHGPGQVAPYLLRSASTLEFIAFEYTPVRYPVTSQLYTPRLRMLVLHILNQQDRSSEIPWNIVLPECPALEHLYLHGDKNNLLDLSFLTKLKQLNHLELSHLTLRCQGKTLKTWALQHSRLRSIILIGVHSVNDMLLEVIAHFSMRERLRIVFRHNDDYSDNGLLLFANQLGHTTIQQIDLKGIVHASPLFLRAISALSTLQSFVVRVEDPYKWTLLR